MRARAHPPPFHTATLTGLNVISSPFFGEVLKCFLLQQRTVADERNPSSEVTHGFWGVMENSPLSQENAVSHSELNVLDTVSFQTKEWMVQENPGLSNIEPKIQR